MECYWCGDLIKKRHHRGEYKFCSKECVFRFLYIENTEKQQKYIDVVDTVIVYIFLIVGNVFIFWFWITYIIGGK